MASYVQAPMTVKADALSQWADAVLENADSISDDAESATIMLNGVKVRVEFDRAKYASPREEAAAAADMAKKLYRQQNKVDTLRHQNDGVEAALNGWRKRVRIAAARGEAVLRRVRVDVVGPGRSAKRERHGVANVGYSDLAAC